MEINEMRKIIDQLKGLETPQQKKIRASSEKEKDRTESSPKTEVITSGEEEFEASPLLKITQKLLQEFPEIRSERVRLIEKHIQEGYYDKKEVEEQAINNLLKFLFP